MLRRGVQMSAARYSCCAFSLRDGTARVARMRVCARDALCAPFVERAMPCLCAPLACRVICRLCRRFMPLFFAEPALRYACHVTMPPLFFCRYVPLTAADTLR